MLADIGEPRHKLISIHAIDDGQLETHHSLTRKPRSQKTALFITHTGHVSEWHRLGLHRVLINEKRIAAKVIEAFQHHVFWRCSKAGKSRFHRVAVRTVDLNDSEHALVCYLGIRVRLGRHGHPNRKPQRERRQSGGPGNFSKRLAHFVSHQKEAAEPPATMIKPTSSQACGCPVNIG